MCIFGYDFPATCSLFVSFVAWLFQILPSKVDPLVSLMRVEKVPDSTYENLGGLEKQVDLRMLLFQY